MYIVIFLIAACVMTVVFARQVSRKDTYRLEIVQKCGQHVLVDTYKNDKHVSRVKCLIFFVESAEKIRALRAHNS